MDKKQQQQQNLQSSGFVKHGIKPAKIQEVFFLFSFGI